MALSPIIKKSSLRISSLSESMASLNRTFNNSIRLTNDIVQTMSERNQLKRKSLSDREKYFNRRREAVRRKEQESIIEASSVSGTIKKTGKVVMDSTKGFLGRIMDFVGTLIVGWMLINLPVIIDGVKKLGERIGALVKVLGKTVTDIFTFLTGFGDLISGVFSNVIRFDFTDSERKVRNAVDKINSSVGYIFNDINNLVTLFSKPIDFGFDELFKDLDDAERSAPSMMPGAGQYTEPKDEMSGGRVSPQLVYQYLRFKGLSHAHAMGILANIEGESKFRVGAKSGDDGGAGGLFQWKKPRSDRMAANVPNWQRNWKGQLDYALVEDAGPAYLKTQFSSPEDAAQWWMVKWERPSERVRGARKQQHNAFIKNFKAPAPDRPSAPSISLAKLGQGKLAANQDVSSIGQGVGRIQITDNYGARGGSHKGIDIAAPSGTYIAVRSDAQVVAVQNFGNRGYGLVVDVWLINEGVQLRFAHCSQVLIRSGKIPAGTSFARVGSTGNSTGPHIHFEYSRTYNDRSYGGSGDASAYVPFILLTKYQNGGRSASVVSPTKEAKLMSIDTTRPESSLRKEKRGATVIVAQPPAQQQQASRPVGGSPPTFDVSDDEDTLNTFMVGKLLLDLAY